MGSHLIFQGMVEDILPVFPSNSFDACFCDPPYLLEFMGKMFDRQHKKENGANDGQKMQAWHERWVREVWRVLKPGGFLLAFGGTRTVHRLASAVEDVGFEVRDGLVWMHAQGFPKSHDIGKSTGSPEWSGYGTTMKPSQEPLVLAMKPTAGTFAENAIEWGVGGINIDGCRVDHGGNIEVHATPSKSGLGKKGIYGASSREQGANSETRYHSTGRWPSNVLLQHHPSCLPLGTKLIPPAGCDIHPNSPGSGPRSNKVYGEDRSERGEWRGYKGEDGMEEVESWECHPLCPVGMLDEQSGNSPAGYRKNPSRTSEIGRKTYGTFEDGHERGERGYKDTGGASRFYFTAKASTSERNLGLRDGLVNNHVTVKPVDLCRYLSTLLLPPSRTSDRHPSASALPPRSLLIPFSGSGSEILGALLAGWDEVTGIEMDEGYIEIAEERIAAIELYRKLLDRKKGKGKSR